MKPIDLLMGEHRLIEKMVSLLRAQLGRLRRGEPPNHDFLEDAVEFFLEYADCAHHGKEEIFFVELGRRELTPGHRKLVEVLTEEHERERRLVRSLGANAAAARSGERGAQEAIVADLSALVELYPLHIAKEDADLFLPAMAYFTSDEREGMLRTFTRFDQGLIHERYRRLVRSWSGA